MLMAASAWSETRLYRYINEQGNMVIDDDIPIEYVKKGYEIINPDGSVIQRVDRQLSEEELRLHNTDAARAQMKKEEERRLQVWDESLMLRYSSAEDIEAALERAQRDLQIRLSILQANLKSTRSQIEQLQGRAADIERRGQKVPSSISKNLTTLRLEMEDIQDSISVRTHEVDEVNTSYQRDIERFSLLLERVKVRRQRR
jgi:chromosome segregation ATPase